MKITRDSLMGLINEVRNQTNSILLEMPGGSSTGTRMGAQDNHANNQDPSSFQENTSKKSLYHLARQADQLHDMISDDDDLEPQVRAKITKAAQYIKDVFESITYEKDNPKGR